MTDILKIKVGLDLHGVIDTYPELFSQISKSLVKAGHEVHVITGSMWREKIERQLKEFDIEYTHHFSISDYLIESGEPVKFTSPDNPWFDGLKWDEAKGKYCKRENIILHIDDSRVYGKYFETPYLQIKR